MNLFTAFFFFFGVGLMAILPFPILYLFSNLMRIILHRVVRYRRKVIEANLRLCFPEMDNTSHNRLVRLIYKNLADIILEGIKAFSMSRKTILKRHKLINPDLLEPFLKSGKSIIGVTGHYANWEWGSLSASLQIQSNVVAFYKILNNPYIDRFVRMSRMKFGTTLANINRTAETFDQHIKPPTIFLMAADQKTLRKSLDKAYWVNFFGKEIPFLHGPEKYSRLHNLPIIYIDIQRVKRGFYEVRLSVLADDASELPEGEVTERYVRKLEGIVIKKPENWLWSHRRWKFVR